MSTTAGGVSAHPHPQSRSLSASTALASVDGAMRALVGDITDENIKAAAERVALLRTRNPAAGDEQLARMAIRQKCIDTGAIGIATSVPALIPGIGSLVAVGAGLVVDIRKTMEMQKDLVLELAAIYGREITEADRRNLLLLVSGVDTTNKLAAKAGSEVAAKLTTRLTSEALAKALPIAGIITSAAINVVSTYLVGQRAQAYLSAGPELAEHWDDTLRTLSGVDERELARWLQEAVAQAQGGLSTSARRVGGALGAAGRSTGSLLATGRDRLLRRKPKSGA